MKGAGIETKSQTYPFGTFTPLMESSFTPGTKGVVSSFNSDLRRYQYNKDAQNKAFNDAFESVIYERRNNGLYVPEVHQLYNILTRYITTGIAEPGGNSLTTQEIKAMGDEFMGAYFRTAGGK